LEKRLLEGGFDSVKVIGQLGDALGGAGD